MATATEPHVRWMIRRDMAEMLAIEAESWRVPWDEEQFYGILRDRNTVARVVEIDGNVEAFVIYELHKTRLEILNLAVARKRRREGLARTLIAELVGKLSPQRRTHLRCDVSEWADGAHHLLRACGFTATAILDCGDYQAYRFEYWVA